MPTMATQQSYLLVYHSHPALPGVWWFDKSNDPDLRVTPMTWGICRTNVRQWVHPGADLFFLAYPEGGRKLPLEDRYYLTARFHVAELICIDEAVRRYPGRPNVILDRLPTGPSLVDRLHDYLTKHVANLAWAERDQILQQLNSGSGALFEQPASYAIELCGEWYVHAYWDQHADWCRRIEAPYIVADTTESRVLRESIPYTRCANECASLPPADKLMSPRIWRHAARRLTPEASRYLIAQTLSAPELRFTPDTV